MPRDIGTRATTRMTSSRKRDLLLGQNRNQVDSSVYANIIFGRTSQKKRNGPVADLSGDEEKITPRPASYVAPARAPGPGVTDDYRAAWKPMLEAFGTLSLSTTAATKKRRLPFLRRIVRNSFFRRCQSMGLAVNPVLSPTQFLAVLYKMAIDVSDDELDNDVTEFVIYEVKLPFDKLVCPLCDTLGRLITKEMLEAHLEWDHFEVEASWRKKQNGVSRAFFIRWLLIFHDHRTGNLRWSFLEARH
ncbi:hypothetical protein BJV78DRAFT_400963 [Lactifluus subvellereus]|nr:hypothetical protein BJV78DRAFT_400963 [Lactifluus subvellereus]